MNEIKAEIAKIMWERTGQSDTIAPTFDELHKYKAYGIAPDWVVIEANMTVEKKHKQYVACVKRVLEAIVL